MPFLSSGQTRTGAPGVSGGTPLYVPAGGGGVGGVSQLVAGSGISLSPAGGTGVVSISATGGGVATIQGLSGAVGITGTGITVGTSGQNITLTATGSGGAITGTSFSNTTTPATVNYTSTAYPIGSPPTTAPALLQQGFNPSNIVIDISSLSAFKMIQIRVLGGNLQNNNTGAGRGEVVALWSELTANPNITGSVFNPALWANACAPNLSATGTDALVLNNNSTLALQTFLAIGPSGPPNGDNLFQSVFIKNPGNTLVLWCCAIQGAGRVWFDGLQVAVSGVL